jgi:ElaB/YqjD/DUF883 family membrane-anchored ribosome-binding protein
MGLGDMVGKAKDLLGGHEEQAEDALEKARDAVKAKTPDNVDAMVDNVVDQAKNFIEKEKD